MFCATLCLSIQQPHILNKALAAGVVSKVTWFLEMMAQVPISQYRQCLAVTKNV
jgi:hypothetical protein